MNTARLGFIAALFAVSPGAFGAAAAPDYPTKPIRLIVAFVPGGGSDILARQFTPKLTEHFGQSFVVDNRGGAGGSIGAEIAAKAAPDGYTLIVVSGSYAANAALYKPAFDPVTGIAPIVEVGFSPFIVSVHPSVAAKSIQELIALARPKPGQLAYGSSGTGGITHLATELMSSMAQIKMVHVPYKASSSALIDLIGGQIQLIVGSMLPTLPHVRSGKIRALAVTRSRAGLDEPRGCVLGGRARRARPGRLSSAQRSDRGSVHARHRRRHRCAHARAEALRALEGRRDHRQSPGRYRQHRDGFRRKSGAGRPCRADDGHIVRDDAGVEPEAPVRPGQELRAGRADRRERADPGRASRSFR